MHDLNTEGNAVKSNDLPGIHPSKARTIQSEQTLGLNIRVDTKMDVQNVQGGFVRQVFRLRVVAKTLAFPPWPIAGMTVA